MSRKYDSVIVFGPTGTVGGLIALEAHKHGAKVWLAMRNTSKAIPEIPPDIEKSGNFARVQADLFVPASVGKAITQSGAKAAFLYLAHGSPDFCRASLQAMRDAGVEYIVFLSSHSVKGEGDALRAIPKAVWNPYAHAQVEIGVEDIGFPYFTVLRPGWFASNYFKNFLNRSVKPLKATVVYEDSIFDNIAPEDIGAVGGAVLTERPQTSDRKQTIYLCGPDARTAKENWELAKKITGRDDIDTTLTSPELFVQTLIANGIPAFVADYLLGALEKARGGFSEPEYQVGVANVEKYAGRPALKFVHYLEMHKAEWQAL
ncbi:NmrA-like family protein [Mycena amicta]|nr:NmrA-like family protein [Mycena amicta]